MYLLKTFLITGIPFGIFWGLFIGIAADFSTSLKVGMITGVSFGFLMSMLVLFLKKTAKRNCAAEVPSGSFKLYEDGANHFKNFESVGGWLILTSKELIFKSHNLNVQIHKKRIPLDQIIEIKRSWTLGLVPNGLEIVADRCTDKFVVFDRKRWIQKINAAIEQQKEAEKEHDCVITKY